MAEDARTVTMTKGELHVLLDQASTAGARKALQELGLNDKKAADDIRDMRGLVSAYRIVRKSVLRKIGEYIAIAVLAYVVGRIH